MIYYIEIIIAHIMILLFTRFRLTGKENVPIRGSLLILSNHLSSGDPVILGAKIGRKVTFMAKQELFKNTFQRLFISSFGAFPVYRQGLSRDALRQASSILMEDKALGMFPEGKRSPENKLIPAVHGSALIAHHNKVPILPVGIYGSERIRGYKWMWHRPRITVTVGRAFYLPEVNHALSKEELANYTGIIMQHIAELLPEEYRGVYGENSTDGIRNNKN